MDFPSLYKHVLRDRRSAQKFSLRRKNNQLLENLNGVKNCGISCRKARKEPEIAQAKVS